MSLLKSMSLVETTKDTRIFLKIAGVVIVCAVLIFLGFKGVQFLQTSFQPPPPAEEGFGKLPSLEFPQSSAVTPEFSIDTISGFLPTFPETIRVYKLEQNEPTIAALPDARIRALSAGFSENEQAISQSEYKWTKPGSNSSLFYELYSFNFSVSPDYATVENSGLIDDERKDQISSAISNFVTTLGGNMTDIKPENEKYSYYELNADGVLPVLNASLATLVRVDLFQSPVNELKIYYPGSESSTLFFVLSKSSQGYTPVEASFHHFTPDLSSSSTYKLKTALEAYDELKAGKGYVSQPTTDQQIGINEVKLGYYLDNNENQKYLLPIIVFKGLNNFQAYISAVKN